jgi:hypothetical protein
MSRRCLAAVATRFFSAVVGVMVGASGSPGQAPNFDRFRNVVEQKSWQATPLAGRTGPGEVFVTAPAGGFLIGFECGLNPFGNVETVAALRPLFRTPTGVVVGPEIGSFADRRVNGRVVKTKVTRTVRLEARDGYAVAGVNARFGLYCDRLSLVFARVANDRLDLADSYPSEWAGTSEGGGPVALDGKGGVPIGVVGFADTGVFGLRFLLAPAPPPAQPANVAAAKPAAPNPDPAPNDAGFAAFLIPAVIGIVVTLVVGVILVFGNKVGTDVKPVVPDDIDVHKIPLPADGRRFSSAVADPVPPSAGPPDRPLDPPPDGRPPRFTGQGYSGLPAAMAERVREELTPGESVVWTGQPSPRVTRLNVVRGAAIALIPSAIGGFLVAVFLVARFNAPNGGVLATLFPLLGLVTLVGGPLLTALFALHRGAKTCYVLTNRRAIVWIPGFFGEGEFDSYSVAMLQLMRRRDSWFISGAGDLVFRTVTTITTTYSRSDPVGRSSSSVARYGFLGLDDVRSVEKLIRHTLIDPVAENLLGERGSR